MRALRRIAMGSAVGLAGALLFLTIGLVRALVAYAGGTPVSLNGIVPDLLYYVLALTVAGSIGGLVWPLTTRRPGRFVVGIVIGLVMMAGIQWLMTGPIWEWNRNDMEGVVGIGLALGLAAGLGIDRGLRAV